VAALKRSHPRLRRLVDDGPVSTECADTLRRLKKEYVPPTEADIAGASALMIVPTAGMTPASDVWQSFIALLDRLAATGKLTGKVGAVIDAGDRQTVVSFSTALTKRGFALIATSSGDARAHGRAVGAAILTQSMPKP
jgi:hypothetical protein